MSDITGAKGRCLCGAVGFTVKGVNKSVGACHCEMCRRWGGGPFMAVNCGTDVSFEGVEHVSVFDSSAWAERGFCAKCGTHLFYRVKEKNLHIMPAGLFCDEPPFVFDHQVFIEEKPEFYQFANKTKNMTGKECFAAFSSEG